MKHVDEIIKSVGELLNNRFINAVMSEQLLNSMTKDVNHCINEEIYRHTNKVCAIDKYGIVAVRHSSITVALNFSDKYSAYTLEEIIANELKNSHVYYNRAVDKVMESLCIAREKYSNDSGNIIHNICSLKQVANNIIDEFLKDFGINNFKYEVNVLRKGTDLYYKFYSNDCITTVTGLLYSALSNVKDITKIEEDKGEIKMKKENTNEIPNILGVSAKVKSYLDITIVGTNNVSTTTSVAVDDIIEYKAVVEGVKITGTAKVNRISEKTLHLDASEKFTSITFPLNIQDIRFIKIVKIER